jgi:hypothetical protein
LEPNLNPWFNRGAWYKLLIPQRIKKCPLNLRVKPGFFETTVKPVSCTMHPRLNHGFRLKPSYINHFIDDPGADRPHPGLHNNIKYEASLSL